MKRFYAICAVTLGSVMALSMLAGCGENGYETLPEGTRICFDNLPDDGIEIDEKYTKYAISDVESCVEYNEAGETVAEGTVVEHTADGVVAKSAGFVQLTKKGGATVYVDVVPAYPTDPGNQFTEEEIDYKREGTLLGGTHDPSLIEVVEDGKPAYYIFSTGWSTGNEIRRSTDLIHWNYLGRATNENTHMPDVEEWIEEENQPDAPAGTYDNRPSLQWWAPDIVPAWGGGYWLYTCCVSNIRHGDEKFSKACIVLFKSDSLAPESFSYVGVLMQSCIPETGAERDINVNSIDPQIIYSPDGKMYMAYGSFGTGNWMLELDPETGLRKDKIYKDNRFLDSDTVRGYRDEVAGTYTRFSMGDDVVSDYYGTMISMANMEAPVIARHDNVTVSDENGVIEENKTFYYSMHSYNGLDVAYQMWGGRSESPMGRYLSFGGSDVYNQDVGATNNSGNKYMGSFTWANKAAGVFEPDIVLPGHNDLFTTSQKTNLAAYITRTPSYHTNQALEFLVQIHQYYLNSWGDICINPNRYGKEIDRSVTKEELLKYTEGGKFKMVCLENGKHAQVSATVSVDVVLTDAGKITYNGDEIGSWLMYGDGYIKFEFTDTSKIGSLNNSKETEYYGVVRPAWLNDQNKSGFTITCLGTTGTRQNMAMFMNNYSTLEVE